MHARLMWREDGRGTHGMPFDRVPRVIAALGRDEELLPHLDLRLTSSVRTAGES